MYKFSESLQATKMKDHLKFVCSVFILNEKKLHHVFGSISESVQCSINNFQ